MGYLTFVGLNSKELVKLSIGVSFRDEDKVNVLAC